MPRCCSTSSWPSPPSCRSARRGVRRAARPLPAHGQPRPPGAAGAARRRRALGRRRVAAVPGLPGQPARAGAGPARGRRAAARRAGRRRRRRDAGRARRCCARRRSATTRRRAVVRAAVPDAATPLCRTCHELTGGNPFFLRELERRAARGRGRARRRRARRGARGRRGVGAGAAQPVPASAQKLAGAAAIVGDGALIRHAAALAELDDDDAAARPPTRCAQAASWPAHARCGSCTRSSAAPCTSSSRRPRGRPATSARRACSPRRMARPSAWRAHLLAPSPAAREWVCDRLRHAAREAVPRGAPDASVTYLRRALEEPPARRQPARHAARARPRGVAHARPRARDRAPAARRRDDDRHRRAALRGTHARGDGRHGQPVGRRRDRRARARGQPRRRPRPGAAHRGPHGQHGPLGSDLAARHLRSAPPGCASASRPASSTALMELTAAAMEVTMAGESAERAAALAERAIEGLKGDPILAVVVGFAAHNLIVSDRLDVAERVLTATIDEARRQQANYRVGPLLVFRSDVRFRAGAICAMPSPTPRRRGTSYAHAGRLTVLGSAGGLVHALTELGELEAAEAALEAADAHGPPDAIGDAYSGTLLLNARARLRLAQGDPRAALADALEAGRRQAAMHEHEPGDAPTGARGPRSPTPRSASRRPRSRWRARRSSSRAASAPRARSGSRCARSARRRRGGAARGGGGRAGRLAGDGSSTPTRSPTSASRSATAAASSRRASRSAGRSTWRPVRRRAARRARPHRAADRRRAAAPRASSAGSRRSPRTSGGWRRWPPTGARTARSRRSCT